MARTKLTAKKNAGESRASIHQESIDRKLSGGTKVPRVVGTVGKAASGGRGGGRGGGGGPDGGKKKYRAKPGTAALREIKKYQMTTDLLVARAPFIRLVREIAQDMRDDVRFTAGALGALQHSFEHYVTDFLDQANRAAIHAKRVTLMPKDINFTAIERNMRETFNLPTKSDGTTSWEAHKKEVYDANAPAREHRKELEEKKKMAAAAEAAVERAVEAAAADQEQAPAAAEPERPKKKGGRKGKAAEEEEEEETEVAKEEPVAAPKKGGRKGKKAAAEPEKAAEVPAAPEQVAGNDDINM